MRSLVTVVEWATARRSRRALAALLFTAATLTACGDNLAPGSTDARTDAAVVDAPVDAPIDAAEIDARPIDARPIDAPTDAAIDAVPVDASTDAPTDAAIDGSTVDQIQAARDTADGSGLTLPIDGVYVTYLKPALGNDPAGFTIQATGTGPALFIAVDPATLNPVPAKGDEVRFTITAMATSFGLRQATAVAGYSRIAVGFNVSALSQNLTNAADVVSALGSYESELVDVSGTLTGSFVAGGSMFEKIQISTPGVPADLNQKVRVPSTLRDALDLVGTCHLAIHQTPMGRNVAEAQFAAFTAADLTVSSCPGPTVASAVATSPITVVITFSRRILAGSVNANGSQFTFDNGLTASAAVVSGRTVTVTTSAQSVIATYTVTVANTVTDLQGTALGNPNTAMFPGFVTPAVVRINELNANIAGSCDLIELRVVTGGSMLNFKLTERTGGSGELNLTFPPVIVPTNGFVVVHLNSTSLVCNPGVATAELTGPMDQPAATFVGNYDTAYDFWNLDTGLTSTDNVFTLFGPTGVMMDAVFAANLVSGTAAAATETAAAAAATANQWQIVGGGVPPGGFIDDAFRANAALDLDGTGTAASGTSIQRLDNTDDNDLADWNTLVAPIIQVQPQTFGALNVGQTAF